MSWSSRLNLWEVCVQVGHSQDTETLHARFVAMGTGYYDYDEVYFIPCCSVQTPWNEFRANSFQTSLATLV